MVPEGKRSATIVDRGVRNSKGAWKTTEAGRQAKYYSLTNSGRKQLQTEEQSWAKLSTAINLVLGNA